MLNIQNSLQQTFAPEVVRLTLLVQIFLLVIKCGVKQFLLAPATRLYTGD